MDEMAIDPRHKQDPVESRYMKSGTQEVNIPTLKTTNFCQDEPSSSQPSSLKVSLPPEQDGPSGLARPSTEGLLAQSATGYGSIPQLEASPRRYPNKDPNADYRYEVSGNLGVPTFRHGSLSGGPSPSAPYETDGMAGETPPKLPESDTQTAPLSR